MTYASTPRPKRISVMRKAVSSKRDIRTHDGLMRWTRKILAPRVKSSIIGRMPAFPVSPILVLSRRRQSRRPGTDHQHAVVPGAGYLDRPQQGSQVIFQFEQVRQQDEQLVVVPFAHGADQGGGQDIDLFRS